MWTHSINIYNVFHDRKTLSWLCVPKVDGTWEHWACKNLKDTNGTQPEQRAATFHDTKEGGVWWVGVMIGWTLIASCPSNPQRKHNTQRTVKQEVLKCNCACKLLLSKSILVVNFHRTPLQMYKSWKRETELCYKAVMTSAVSVSFNTRVKKQTLKAVKKGWWVISFSSFVWTLDANLWLGRSDSPDPTRRGAAGSLWGWLIKCDLRKAEERVRVLSSSPGSNAEKLTSAICQPPVAKISHLGFAV